MRGWAGSERTLVLALPEASFLGCGAVIWSTTYIELILYQGIGLSICFHSPTRPAVRYRDAGDHLMIAGIQEAMTPSLMGAQTGL
jgi:hypothetical protein